MAPRAQLPPPALPHSAHCEGVVTEDQAPRTELHGPSRVLLPSKPGHFPALGTRYMGLGGRWTHRQRQRCRQRWRPLLPEPAALTGAMTDSTAGACLLQLQHPNPAAQGACVPGRACSHTDTQRGPRLGASPLLSFPSVPGWQAVKAPSPRLGCQGDRASGRKGGAGPTPGGAGSFSAHTGVLSGKHKDRVVERRCPMPAFGWSRGSQARLGAKHWVGTAGQPAPTGSPHRVGAEVPPPWQEQPLWEETCLSQHLKPCNKWRGWGSPHWAQPVSPCQGCIHQQTPPSSHCAPKGGCFLAQEGTIWVT